MVVNQSSQSVYSAEAVQQILQRAMAYGDRGQFTADQLGEMAAELGIAADTLQQATQDWQGESAAVAQADQVKRDRRRRYRAEVATYAGVNALLIGINIATAGAITWAIYPLLGWGIGLCLGPCKAKANPFKLIAQDAGRGEGCGQTRAWTISE